jgi:hypothetical protein
VPADDADRIDKIACIRNRKFNDILDLELTVATIDTELTDITTLDLHRCARRLISRRIVPVVHRHRLFLRRRAMRTIVILLQRHGTGLQGEIKPDSREQAQDPFSGPVSLDNIGALVQVVVSNVISHGTVQFQPLGYWQCPLSVKCRVGLIAQAVPGFHDDVLTSTVVRISTRSFVIHDGKIVRLIDFRPEYPYVLVIGLDADSSTCPILFCSRIM